MNYILTKLFFKTKKSNDEMNVGVKGGESTKREDHSFFTIYSQVILIP
jgi:hypothetical protein